MVSRRVIRAVTPPTLRDGYRVHRRNGVSTIWFADSICCWVYSRLPTVKTRWSIAGTLLFVLALAPFAMLASARPMGASSCHLADPRSHSNIAGKRKGGNLVQLVASRPGHHTPAPRLHRIRGKRINVQGNAILALQCFTTIRVVVQEATSGLRIMDGPNPSRGPPSQLSLQVTPS